MKLYRTIWEDRSDTFCMDTWVLSTNSTILLSMYNIESDLQVGPEIAYLTELKYRYINEW